MLGLHSSSVHCRFVPHKVSWTIFINYFTAGHTLRNTLRVPCTTVISPYHHSRITTQTFPRRTCPHIHGHGFLSSPSQARHLGLPLMVAQRTRDRPQSSHGRSERGKCQGLRCSCQIRDQTSSCGPGLRKCNMHPHSISCWLIHGDCDTCCLITRKVTTGSGKYLQATLGLPDLSPIRPRLNAIVRLCGHMFCVAYHSPRLAKLYTAS